MIKKKQNEQVRNQNAGSTPLTNDSLLTPQEFTRLANNFYVGRNLDTQLGRISLDADLVNYVLGNLPTAKQKSKVAFCCICLNPRYWQFIKPLVEGARTFFLPGHQTDFFIWSDIPKPGVDLKPIEQTLFQDHQSNFSNITPDQQLRINEYVRLALEGAKQAMDFAQTLTVFPTEPETWPMPTLMRYHLMAQQEETLKNYDYVFYCDIDMVFVNPVGDEILSDGLTAVQQPMYAVRKEYWPPYEPNPQSASYIKRPGMIVDENGRPRFMPLYFAGGFQGGRTKDWLEAMAVMKKKIDDDFNKNYIPIWNDETVWNSYLFEKPPTRVLSPSYTYPDSLIKEYFEPMWGQSYIPKLVTLTKKFSFHEGGGDHVTKVIEETKALQK